MKKPLGIPASTIPSGAYPSRPTAPQRGAAVGRSEKTEAYKEFSASELYCPKCGVAMPVREKPLLYLPTGEVSDYRCARCHTVVGTKRT